MGVSPGQIIFFLFSLSIFWFLMSEAGDWFMGNKPFGQVHMEYPRGGTYIGEMNDGKKHGYGTRCYDHLTYIWKMAWIILMAVLRVGGSMTSILVDLQCLIVRKINT